MCAELETEEPRSGCKREAPPEQAPEASAESGEDGEAATGGAAQHLAATGTDALATTGSKALAQRPGMPIRRVVSKVTTTVKLNNNMLETLQGLALSLEVVMISPIVNLQWIDLSFNQLVTVEKELERFLNLKALYLHGNCITRISCVERLRRLPKLMSLTLNGNPIESSKQYRPFIIGCLPNLRSLDHSTIIPDEVASAQAWYTGYLERSKKRAEERAFNATLRED